MFCWCACDCSMFTACDPAPGHAHLCIVQGCNMHTMTWRKFCVSFPKFSGSPTNQEALRWYSLSWHPAWYYHGWKHWINSCLSMEPYRERPNLGLLNNLKHNGTWTNWRKRKNERPSFENPRKPSTIFERFGSWGLTKNDKIGAFLAKQQNTRTSTIW